jgi:hypothetical protein
MIAIRLCAALLVGLPFVAAAQAQTPAAAAQPPAAVATEQAKPTKAEIRAKKKEEIAREKAAVSTPLDPQAAMETRKLTKEKRATCKQEAKAQNIGLFKRRSFMKDCEAG